jgi:multidrug transporter EmrE-like cation transporter
MNRALVAISLGLLSQILGNLGLGVQKQGSTGLREYRNFFKSSAIRMLLGIWVVGVVMRVIATFISFPAVALGQASIIASFGGIGVATLVIYAALVLREPISPREMLGVHLIIGGTVLAGYFGAEVTQAPVNIVHLDVLVMWSLGMVFACLAASIWTYNAAPQQTGLVFGMCAGVADGLGLLFCKVMCDHTMSQGVMHNFVDLWSWAWVAVSIASFVLIQAAYLRARAVTVVPAYTCVTIVVPVLAAPFVFGDVLGLPLLAGVSLLLLGIVTLSMNEQPVFEALAA